MSVADPQPTTLKPTLGFRLRTLLLVVAAASGWLAWQVYRVHEEANAVAALRELRADATSKVRDPIWLWGLFGDRLGRTTVRIELYAWDVEVAIPYLKALPDLKEVVVIGWPHENLGDEAETLLHNEMPQVNTQRYYLMLDGITVTQTVCVPNAGEVLMEGLQRLKGQYVVPPRIVIPEEE